MSQMQLPGMRGLVFRTIDVERDRAIVVRNYRDTHRASYGAGSPCPVGKYLPWLQTRVEEFPDGHVLAMLGERCVGQLELQVPYGLNTGYVNLYCVTPPFRGQGYGRALHEYSERYFRSWEAERVELHVSSTNNRAVGFYRRMGYHLMKVEGGLWRMSRLLDHSSAARDNS